MNTRAHYDLTSRWQRLSHASTREPAARFAAFMLIEAASFYFVALVHFGTLVPGHEHALARAAETVIASVLVLGVLGTWIAPAYARSIGFAVQAFAFFATVVSLLMIAVGVGPRSVPDLIFNSGMLLLLSLGLYVVARLGRDPG